jgi:hypothetical protein
MKLVKFSILVFLFSIILVACGDDSSTDPGDEVETPNGKVTIITTVNGDEQDRRIIERKGGEITPNEYSISGTYSNTVGQIDISIFEESITEYNYKVNLSAKMNELRTGTYIYTANDEKLNWGSYSNITFGSEQYEATNVTLVITKVEYISITELVGSYYITGTLTMDMENQVNENPNVEVNVLFENMAITKLITGF